MLLQDLFDPEIVDIRGLADCALRSFAVIERCKTQTVRFPCCPSTIISQVIGSSEHHLVATMVNKVTRQADEYVRAIDMSLDAAQKGCEFADDAIELCNFVAMGDAHLEDLNRFLSEMLDKANTVHT
jgi:hypothetical protein